MLMVLTDLSSCMQILHKTTIMKSSRCFCHWFWQEKTEVLWEGCTRDRCCSKPLYNSQSHELNFKMLHTKLIWKIGCTGKYEPLCNCSTTLTILTVHFHSQMILQPHLINPHKNLKKQVILHLLSIIATVQYSSVNCKGGKKYKRSFWLDLRNSEMILCLHNTNSFLVFI